MSPDVPSAALQRQLVITAGGFLRNLVTDGTCVRCFTPTHSLPLCPPCVTNLASVPATGRLPDAIGFMTYASREAPIEQSGRVMHGYKARDGLVSPNAIRTVSLLTALGLQGHRHCPGRLVGAPVTRWATVPSLPPKPGDHPLNTIVRPLANRPDAEICLRGIDNPGNPRDLRATNFTVQTPIPAGTHVLLIDDTWTSGGHAQSAALALRAAGAAHVSLLALARWLRVPWEATTTTWMKTHFAGADYDPTICPWTRGPCPLD